MKTPKKTMTWSLALLCLFLSQNVTGQLKDSTQVTSFITFTIHSEILNEDRKISVQLPLTMDRYSAYPVLYLIDGESFSSLAGGQVEYLSEKYKIIP